MIRSLIHWSNGSMDHSALRVIQQFFWHDASVINEWDIPSLKLSIEKRPPSIGKPSWGSLSNEATFLKLSLFLLVASIFLHLSILDTWSYSHSPFQHNSFFIFLFPFLSLVIFVGSVRSSNSHPDLVLIHPPHHPTTPLFQITLVLNTELSLSEPLQLYKGYNAI